jgi:phenylpropionate dioxygenase-like ring-hydroxylating dioxygenase large terminal subunit
VDAPDDARVIACAGRGGWVEVAATADVAPGSVVPVEAMGAEWVLWRTEDGAPAVMPRRCPHLDHDLAEARVVRAWLVCPGHEWCFDPAGHAGKVNVKGRFDRKDDVVLPALREREGRVELAFDGRAGPAGAAGDGPGGAR